MLEHEWKLYPLVLGVNDVAKILDIGRNSAYDLFHQPGFPVLRVGRNFRVSRDSFRRWVEEGKNIA